MSERRIDVDNINLRIIAVEPFNSTIANGITISWQADIGFGEYVIYKRCKEDKWRADSETMDYGEDKAFGRKLMQLLMDMVEIN